MRGGARVFGSDVELVRRLIPASLGQFTANATATKKTGIGLPPGVKRARILGIHVMGDAVPLDADGTLLMTVRARDVSEAAFDILVNQQDLEALITQPDRYFKCTLAAESSEQELTLEEGDTIDAQLINNSAAIDTNPNLFLMVEIVELPNFDERQTVSYNHVV